MMYDVPLEQTKLWWLYDLSFETKNVVIAL